MYSRGKRGKGGRNKRKSWQKITWREQSRGARGGWVHSRERRKSMFVEGKQKSGRKTKRAKRKRDWSGARDWHSEIHMINRCRWWEGLGGADGGIQ